MKISAILAHKGGDTVTIAPDATVSDLLARLAEHGIGAVLVSTSTEVLGIVSERDVVRRLYERGSDILTSPVETIMTADVVSCSPDDEVDQVAETMTARRIRHMPVIADGFVLGLVSIGDVVKSRIGELEQERGLLEQYITG